MSSTDTTPDAPLDLATEQARLARAQTEYTEMQNQLARGEMMTVGDFHTMVENALVHVGAKMLALCDEIAPLVVGKTAAEAEAIIDTAIRAALKELGDAAEAAFPEDDPEAA